MGANVKISPAELTRATRMVKAYDLNWPPIMKATAIATTRWIDRNFRTEGKMAQLGGWEELSPITVAFRRADWRQAQEKFLATGKGSGYGGRPSPAAGPGSGKLVPMGENLGPSSYKILDDTGELKGSVSSRVGKIHALVGFSSIKAGTHQYGRKQFWPLLGKVVTIPARPILPNEVQASRIFTRTVITAVRLKVGKIGKVSKLKPPAPPAPM